MITPDGIVLDDDLDTDNVTRGYRIPAPVVSTVTSPVLPVLAVILREH